MVSKSLQNRMKKWKLEKTTQPRRNTLASVAASRMTPQQIKNLLSANLLLYKNTAKNIEHRMRNLAVQNNNMRKFMERYLLNKTKK